MDPAGCDVAGVSARLGWAKTKDCDCRHEIAANARWKCDTPKQDNERKKEIIARHTQAVMSWMSSAGFSINRRDEKKIKQICIHFQWYFYMTQQPRREDLLDEIYIRLWSTLRHRIVDSLTRRARMIAHEIVAKYFPQRKLIGWANIWLRIFQRKLHSRHDFYWQSIRAHSIKRTIDVNFNWRNCNLRLDIEWVDVLDCERALKREGLFAVSSGRMVDNRLSLKTKPRDPTVERSRKSSWKVDEVSEKHFFGCASSDRW